MAISAPYNTAFGSITAYLYVSSYTLDRSTALTTGKIQVFKDATTRDAYKAAQAALSANNAQIKQKEADLQAVIAAWNAKTDAEKGMDGALATYNASVTAARAAIDAIKADSSAQYQTLQANKAGAEDVFSIPPGGVPVSEAAAVTVGDIYGWLMANKYPDGAEV